MLDRKAATARRSEISTATATEPAAKDIDAERDERDLRDCPLCDKRARLTGKIALAVAWATLEGTLFYFFLKGHGVIP